MTFEDSAMARSTGRALMALFNDHSKWSQETFGTDAERGPVGALKHLKLEAQEAVEAFERVKIVEATPHSKNQDVLTAFEDFEEEMADCLILLLDAGRRGGLQPIGMIAAAQDKMVVNKARKFPKPTTDEPSQHLKGAV